MVVLPACWVSVVRGRRQESQSIWTPFACADQAGPAAMEPVACGEGRAPGQTRAWHEGSKKVCF